MDRLRRKLSDIAHRKKVPPMRVDSKSASALASVCAALSPTRSTLKSFDFCDGPLFQNYQIVWLDTDVNAYDAYASSDATDTLRHIADCTNTFIDVKDCTDFIDRVDEGSVFLIVSGPLIRSVMPAVHGLPRITSIYILCENKLEYEGWVHQWPKVKSVCMDMAFLCAALRQAAQECDRNTISISCIEANGDPLDDSFTYVQSIKEIIMTNESTEQNVKEFITFYRQQVLSNGAALKNIEKLEREYRDHGAIWWYTSPCFLDSMLHRALRTMAMDTIIKMGFFMHDLHQQISQLHAKRSASYQHHHSTLFVVYRGQGIASTDFERLKSNQGGLLAFNSFLFATKNRHISLNYAHQAVASSDLMGVLFVLTIDPSTTSTPFAHIRDVCCAATDEEILFSLQPVFRIDGIKPMDNHSDRFWQVELTLREPTVEGTASREQGWCQLSGLLLAQNRLGQAEQVCRSALSVTFDDKKKAALHYQLGLIELRQENYTEAISSYKSSLEIRQRIFDCDHVDVAACYSGMGLIYEKTGEYSKALCAFEKAFDIYDRSVSDDSSCRITYINNIARVCLHMEQYVKSLLHYQKALEICSKVVPSDPSALAAAHHNIGTVYEKMNDHESAISSFQETLTIYKKILASSHPDVAEAYHTIGSVYEKMREHAIALTYYEQALDIYENMHPANHANLAATYTNIGMIYFHRANYLNALNSYEKAHEIYRTILPPNHPDLAASYMRHGTVYEQMHKYKKALLYYQKAIEVYKSSRPIDCSGLANVYHNVSSVYEKMGEHSTATSFSECASDIEHKSLPRDASSVHSAQRSWLTRRRRNSE